MKKGVYQHLGATPKCWQTHKKESTPGEAVSIGAFLVFFRALSYKGGNEPIPQVLKQVVNLSCYLLYS